MQRKLVNIVFAAFVVGLIIVLFLWMGNDPTKDFKVGMPGEDNRGKQNFVEQLVNIGENFSFFKNHESDYTEIWDGFRGNNRDNISKSKIALKDSWSNEEPEIMWQVELGEGHAGVALYEGKAYILDYIEDSREDALRCFSIETGDELWQRSYNVNLKRNHGMSRTVPALTEDYIVTIGPKCHVMCVKRENGDFVWGLDMVKEYETEVPFWYTGQCPLIDDDKVVLAPGGTSLLIAVDIETGKLLWETRNSGAWKMSHSSIVKASIFGEDMYVYSAVGGVCGISMDGEILWESRQWNHSVVAPSPVVMPDGKVFLTAGYGAGSMVLQLKQNDTGIQTEVLKEFSPKEGLACEQQTPILWDGHLFGILPKDAGIMRNQLICVHPDDVTNIVWSSGKTNRFGLGPYMIADNKMFILSDDGTLTVIKPNINSYQQLAQKKLFDGHDAWAPLAVADGKMLLRDSKTMYCIDLKK